MTVPAWMRKLKKYKDGVNRTPEQDTMIANYLPKVKKWVKLCAGCGLDMEDLVAYGTLALIKGVDYFELEKCTTTIDKYLKSCVLHELRKAVSYYGGMCKIPPYTGLRMSQLNKKTNKPLTEKQYEHARNMRYGWCSLSEAIENNVAYHDEDDSYDEVEKILGLLRPRHRYIVEELVIKERRSEDVGKDLGVTRTRVNQLRTEALFQLRTGVTIGYKAVMRHAKVASA